MSDAWPVLGRDSSPVECRHCGSPGTIRPNPAGRGRPLFTWTSLGCAKAEHEPTPASMAQASRDWWKQHKAQRPRPPAPPPSAPRKKPLTPAGVLGLVLFLVVVVWLLTGAPTG